MSCTASVSSHIHTAKFVGAWTTPYYLKNLKISFRFLTLSRIFDSLRQWNKLIDFVAKGTSIPTWDGLLRSFPVLSPWKLFKISVAWGQCPQTMRRALGPSAWPEIWIILEINGPQMEIRTTACSCIFWWYRSSCKQRDDHQNRRWLLIFETKNKWVSLCEQTCTFSHHKAKKKTRNLRVFWKQSTTRPHQKCHARRAQICEILQKGFSWNIFAFPEMFLYQWVSKWPAIPIPEAINSCKYTDKIWKIPNHKRDTATRWCIPQIPDSKKPSGQTSQENFLSISIWWFRDSNALFWLAISV